MNRRAFVGMTAGAAVAGTGIVLNPWDTTAAAQSFDGTDALLGQISDELIRACKFMEGKPTGEGARRVATSLRLLAAWGRSHKLDDRLKSQVRNAVRRKGRSAIVTQSFDLDAELKLRGWTVPPGSLSSMTTTDISDALDDMQRAGLTAHWSDYAKAFDRAAADLDKNGGAVTAVGRRATDAECQGMQYMLLMLETQAFLACTVGIAMGPEFCAIAAGVILPWKWYMWSSGC